ncbi:protein-glutamine gamma-glutamyltransferase [Alkalihalobacillus sp. MEB130]|uniref:protein-glutamine gamma-glutamyltransferase n=1 Tax=Alkalihalobacillus sp. MEB130 TaxID=2976704 RepID=UPI0028DF19BD|nr:protein-glutamine gamma-glutamyltransferase [Alkalihalobacillus sp. MEB130]MDT8860272.1 protein-glutamine gamma-glutamyltransferase [Alkalihalobacillus sp. MEB130]
MIQIMGTPFQMTNLGNFGNVERMIIQRMHEDPALHPYRSMDEFLFEVHTRKNIIDSSIGMNDSEMEFTVFEYARCNPQYWHLTDTGGFWLRGDVQPSNAIRDIYENSSLYAFDCSTACVIIFYHAVLNSIGDHNFNLIFPNLYLYSWHADSDLGLHNVYTQHYIPGDVVYFNNPDFHPEIYWLRGENAVVLGDDTYFGHGFGIMNAQQMIETLNENRRPQSTQSAYLLDSITRLNFNHLASITMLQRGYLTYKKQQMIIHHNQTSISFIHYLFYLNQSLTL